MLFPTPLTSRIRTFNFNTVDPQIPEETMFNNTFYEEFTFQIRRTCHHPQQGGGSESQRRGYARGSIL